MYFIELTDYFAKLEKTTSRLTITEILAGLFKKTSAEEIGQVCYLLQGRVVPLYNPIEFRMADRMVIRSIEMGMGVSQGKIMQDFKQTGDLGKSIERLKTRLHLPTVRAVGGQVNNSRLKNKNVKISEVFEILYKLATLEGERSQEAKINLLGNLIKNVDPVSARFITSMVLGKLRLGFSDMTIIDSLSWMLTGGKKARIDLETAYNVRPDLGWLAKTVKKSGLTQVTQTAPSLGTPILMARANRLDTAEDILLKIGKCAVEHKYDGLRVQVHYKKRLASSVKRLENKHFIKLFSRNLEDITEMFPDICAAVPKQVMADEAIFEGEIVAYNPENDIFVPFQETMQRKRKYDIAAKAQEIPVKLFVFELLYINGKNLVKKPYIHRKAELKKIIKKDDLLIYAQEYIVSRKDEVNQVFQDAIKKRFEGIIAKKLDGVYQAGMRGWNWIKFKKAMDKKLMDTIDVLVMGFTKGEGKRTVFGVGQFLTGVYDDKKDQFLTVSKIGTGLTDEQFREFMKRVQKLHVKEKPKNYEIDKLLEPDVWLAPGLVVEVSSDEITRSPIHTAGRILQPSKSGKAFSVKTPGFALRFPRLERFRDDKRPTDATTVKELTELFKKQKK